MPQLRLLSPEDSIEALTELLHRAYAEHATAGRRFFASYQTADDTRHRVARGVCWVAAEGGRLLGTVTVVAPYVFPVGYPAPPRSATFYQLAVDPSHRARGLGSSLLQRAEAIIREAGVTEVAIDTSELATDLIAWYERRGYRREGTWRWSVTNYDSVVMRKSLPG